VRETDWEHLFRILGTKKEKYFQLSFHISLQKTREVAIKFPMEQVFEYLLLLGEISSAGRRRAKSQK
jgi:hypothetical protein